MAAHEEQKGQSDTKAVDMDTVNSNNNNNDNDNNDDNDGNDGLIVVEPQGKQTPSRQLREIVVLRQ